MTYKRNFVAALKVGGKVLRESGDQVELPFGSEYSILLKNLNSVRAQAQVTIDGKVATTWLILGPNSTLEIERLLRADNLDRGNKFKFIERTEAVEKHRGVQLEDGLIRIEFKKEKVFEVPKVVEHHTYHHHYDNWPYRPYVPAPWPKYPWHEPYITLGGGNGTLGSASGGSQITAMNMSLGKSSSPTRSLHASMGAVHSQNFMKSSEIQNAAGITVPGSESNQKFVTVSDFATETSEVVTIKLVGARGKVKVARPITVDIRAVCQTCGKRAKGSAKFCQQCGTSLEII